MEYFHLFRITISNGLQWTPIGSNGLKQAPLESSGLNYLINELQKAPMGSIGLPWSSIVIVNDLLICQQWTPKDYNGLQWAPMGSNGLQLALMD